ncbi:hypothetical protein PS403_06745 [Pediococcus acidilactici]
MRDAGRVLAILVAAVVIIFGWKYYQENYQAETAYAVVPSEVPAKKTSYRRQRQENIWCACLRL